MSATQNAPQFTPLNHGTVDAAEVAKFEAMAAEWWDPNGKFKPLHMLNPCRLDYIVDQIAAEFGRDPKAPRPFAGLRLLDIGCGGGLLAEPMARLGAEVMGVDAAPRNIPVAELHAAQSELAIDYRHGTAEALSATGERFDVVLNMEVVEHVADPPAYLAACRDLLKPGGLMICSTINRNPRSWLLAIVGAEHVMRWLPQAAPTTGAASSPRMSSLRSSAAPASNPSTARASSSTRSAGVGASPTATSRSTTSPPASAPASRVNPVKESLSKALERRGSCR